MLAVVFFMSVLTIGMIVLLDQPQLLLHVEVNFPVLALCCFLIWYSFVFRGRYETIIDNYKAERKETERFANGINVVVFLVFALAGASVLIS